MKVLLFMLLALFYGGLALAQGEDPTETRVKAWLKEKRTAFYASRAKDPAVQNFLLLYEQLEKDGRICRQTVSPGLKLEAIRTNEETVRVNWYATTATNVEGYILERSLGNNAPFEQVHYIKADPSITTQAFQFNDNNSYAEKSIYRVVQVFLSGERLEKKAVAGGYNTDLKVTAYPNPSAHNFTLFIQSRRDEPLQLRVVDVLGRVVEQKDNLPANQLIEIGAQYRTGIFFVQILQAGKTKQVKVEKRDSQAQ